MQVYFNGTALSQVSPLTKVQDFIIPALNAQLVTRDNPVVDGVRLVRNTRPPRTIRVLLRLGARSVANRAMEHMQIAAWAMSNSWANLTVDFLGDNYFEAVCSSFPVFQEDERTVEVVFLAVRPELVRSYENKHGDTSDLRIGGTVATWIDMRYTIIDHITDEVWTIGDRSITMDGTVYAGDIEINSRKETIMHTASDGTKTSLLGMLTPASKFFYFEPGVYTPAITYGNFYWHERVLI